MQISGGRIYLAIAGGIVSLPISGGDFVTEVAIAQPAAYAVQGGHIYWLDTSANVWSVATGGGKAPVQLAATPLLRDPPLLAGPALVADDANIYWSGAQQTDTMYSVPVGGGPVQAVAPAQDGESNLYLNGGTLYWTTPNGTVTSTSAPKADIWKLAVPAGAPVLVALGEVDPTHLTMVGMTLYWAQSDGFAQVTTLRLMPQGKPARSARKVSVYPATAFAIGQHGVYWSPGSLVIGAPLPM
jgi:hypothetical protein